jgi:hypothetical protein
LHHPWHPNSAAKAFADLKEEMDKERAVRNIARTEVDTLTQAVKDLKITVDKFVVPIPTLEDKVNITPSVKAKPNPHSMCA